MNLLEINEKLWIMDGSMMSMENLSDFGQTLNQLMYFADFIVSFGRRRLFNGWRWILRMNYGLPDIWTKLWKEIKYLENFRIDEWIGDK